MTQKVHTKVLFPDGNLAEFGKEYRVLATNIMVWDGRRNYTGGPVEQTGITITHIVSKGDWVCIGKDNCGWRGTQAEAKQHPHNTTVVKEVI